MTKNVDRRKAHHKGDAYIGHNRDGYRRGLFVDIVWKLPIIERKVPYAQEHNWNGAGIRR